MKKTHNFISYIIVVVLCLASYPSFINAEAQPFDDSEAVVTEESNGDNNSVETANIVTEESKTEEVKSENSNSEESSGNTQYTVQPGDYLIAIASRQMGDGSRWQEIVELNKDKYPSLATNPNLIYPGWVFTLPSGSKGNTVANASNNKVSNSTPVTNTLSGSNTIITPGVAQDSSGWGSADPCTPMAKRVSSEYGYRTHPVTGKKGTFHNGVDLPIPSGTRLNAMANGVVTAVGFENGGGNYLRIKYDNGYETFYCHLQGSTVKVGDRVECGQQVALSDNTGIYTTGAHLHMEVKVNGERVNPRTVVSLP